MEELRKYLEEKKKECVYEICRNDSLCYDDRKVLQGKIKAYMEITKYINNKYESK